MAQSTFRKYSVWGETFIHWIRSKMCAFVSVCVQCTLCKHESFSKKSFFDMYSAATCPGVNFGKTLRNIKYWIGKLCFDVCGTACSSSCRGRSTAGDLSSCRRLPLQNVHYQPIIWVKKVSHNIPWYGSSNFTICKDSRISKFAEIYRRWTLLQEAVPKSLLQPADVGQHKTTE